MKKKRFMLPLALIMAGTIAFGTGCGPEKSSPEVTVQDGFVYVDGVKTDVEVGTEKPELTVQDGFVYVNGVKTDIEVGTPAQPERKSAFELWKEDNPSYTGTEQEWLDWLDRLNGKQDETEDVMEYKLIENGIWKGGVTAGTAVTENSVLKLNNAVLRLNESVVLPLDASWEVRVTGKLLTGSGTGAQFFAGNPFSEYGRVYFGVNKSSRMLYIGVRLNTVYVNYGWKFDDASFFNGNHSYDIGYDGKTYYLAVDGGEKMPMSDINFNQTNPDWLEDPETDAQNLNTLIRTVLAQDNVEMTNIGAEGFACNAEIGEFTVKTSPAKSYKRLLAHPLADTRIFYLGSSITYGSASNGVAFGDIMNKITGNPYAKEAVSGTTLVDNGSSSYVQRLKNGALNFAENPDYLVVQLSTNDFSQGKPLGTVQSGTKSSDFDTSTVSGAIQYIIAYAKEQCPDVKVVFYVGAVRNNWGFRSAYEEYVYGDFQKICEKWEIEPLDIFHTKYKSYACFWSDDIHPTVEGYSAGWTPLFIKYFTDRL